MSTYDEWRKKWLGSEAPKSAQTSSSSSGGSTDPDAAYKAWRERNGVGTGYFEYRQRERAAQAEQRRINPIIPIISNPATKADKVDQANYERVERGDKGTLDALYKKRTDAFTGYGADKAQAVAAVDKEIAAQKAKQKAYQQEQEARSKELRLRQKQAEITNYNKYAKDPNFMYKAVDGKTKYEKAKAEADAAENNLAAEIASAMDPNTKLGASTYTADDDARVEKMREGERNIYFYLLSSQGKEAAKRYIDLLSDTLNARIGEENAKVLQDNDLGGLVAPVAGAYGAVEGTMNLIGGVLGKESPTSAMQQTSRAVRGNLSGVEGTLYDLAYTAGNMAPSMAISAATVGLGAPGQIASALGSATFGTSAAGNKYKQALDEGYSQDQALSYGLLTGASEAGLQYVLGGISKLGLGKVSGAVSGKVSSALSKIIKNQNIVDGISRLVGSMGSEGAEEYLQEVLDPVFKNVAAGEHNDINLISEEALYSGLLGALTGGLFEGFDMASWAINNRSKAPVQAATVPGVETIADVPAVPGSAVLIDERAGISANPNTMESTNTGAPVSSVRDIAAAKGYNHAYDSSISDGMNRFKEIANDLSIKAQDPGIEYSKNDYEEMATKRLSEFTENDIRAIVTGLQKSRSGTLYLKDVSRVLDAVSGNNSHLRQALYNVIERPFNEAGGRYGRALTDVFARYDSDMRALGIKPGTAEDAAVMKFGEGQYMDVDGTIREYALGDLQKEFPHSWERIIEADKINRKMYDDYLANINKMREEIYPRILQRAQAELNDAKSSRDAVIVLRNNQADLVAQLEAKLHGMQNALQLKKRTNTQAYVNLKNSIERMEHRIQTAKEKLGKFEARISDIEYRILTNQQAIENGDVLHQKKIVPRKDYYHHVRELSSALDLAAIFGTKGAGSELNTTTVAEGKAPAGGIGSKIDKAGSILERILVRKNGSREIAPEMVGVSDNTTPRAKFEGILEQRKGGRYKQSAYAGMVDYISSAEFMLAYDPLTAYYRSLDGAMVKAAQEQNARQSNQFREWLKDWTDLLTGKTDHLIDRGVQKVVGRNIINGINNLNSTVKSSTLLFNLRSSVVQVSNIPNAMGYIPDLKDWENGARYHALAKSGNPDYADVYAQSNFMAQRYSISARDVLAASAGDKIKNAGAAVLECGQKYADELTWWSAYARYLRDPNSAQVEYSRQYDNAIDFADDITRRSAGGRGIGEVPLLLNSKVVNTFSPFQIELNNLYQTIKENVGGLFKNHTSAQRTRSAKGLAAYEIGAFVFNAASRALFGDSVLGFDYINVIVNAIKNLIDDDDETVPLQGFVQDAISTTVGGLPIANLLPAVVDDEHITKVLGEGNSPSRYGTGIMGVNAVGDAVGVGIDLINGEADVWDIAKAAANFNPYGGRQLYRTAQGIDTIVRGGSYTKDAEGKEQLQFSLPPTPTNIAKAALFGKWATKPGQEYIENGFPIVSAKDTEAYRAAMEAGIDGSHFMLLRSEIKAIEPVKDRITGQTIQSATEQARILLYNDATLTPEQKRVIDKALIGSAGWAADYSSKEMFELSLNKDAWNRYQVNIRHGMTNEEALRVESYRKNFIGDGGNYEEGRKALMADQTLTAEQKAQIDKSYTDKPADYSSPEMFELSLMGSSVYYRAQTYMAADERITAGEAVAIEQYRKEHKTKDEMIDFLFDKMGYGKARVNAVLEAYGWKPI